MGHAPMRKTCPGIILVTTYFDGLKALFDCVVYRGYHVPAFEGILLLLPDTAACLCLSELPSSVLNTNGGNLHFGNRSKVQGVPVLSDDRASSGSGPARTEDTRGLSSFPIVRRKGRESKLGHKTFIESNPPKIYGTNIMQQIPSENHNHATL